MVTHATTANAKKLGDVLKDAQWFMLCVAGSPEPGQIYRQFQISGQVKDVFALHEGDYVSFPSHGLNFVGPYNLEPTACVGGNQLIYELGTGRLHIFMKGWCDDV
jgi:hypothetical protein